MAYEVIKEALLELLAPTRCAGCERPGSVLCDTCIEELGTYRTTHPCPRCGAPYGELVCTECQTQDHSFSRVWCLGELDGPLSRAIVIYKDAFEIRLGPLLGDLLAQHCAFQCIAHEMPIEVVTWIPPSVRALRQRGYDHAGILAHCVARRLGLEATQYLKRRDRRDMRKLTREQRQQEARDSYQYLDDKVDHTDTNLLIVDDVLTTGATLDGAAQMYLDRGAQTVIGAVLARAW
ncbi:MAG: double zinc ribbon domain-containing protein [Actinomycetia bacterium]|nr:double zinc ribbon domain-containing protein [Actinomycetes bacterium]